MRNWLNILLVTCGFLSIANASNTLKFANYYQSHMVLQKSPEKAVLWRYATTLGDTVVVKLNGLSVAQVTVTGNTDGAGGVWVAKFPAQRAGGPNTISITSRDGNVTISDVLFGDVWVCSGQSNMQFKMHGILNASEKLIESSHFKNIRFMQVLPTESNTTRQDVNPSINWKQPANGTCKDLHFKMPSTKGVCCNEKSNNSEQYTVTSLFSAVCLLYAMELSPHINRPIGLIESTWGGTPVEAWSSPDARNICSQRRKRDPRDHHALWNAMIHPLLPLTIYGVIWYQGEANANKADQYACTFPAMIDDWRQKFHQKSLGETSLTFPFGFVQLSALRNTTYVGLFPDLRWSQTAKYGYAPNPTLQNVFMAVAMDLPDFQSPWGAIHPRDKLDVARRLALSSRAVAYQQSNLNFQGPRYTSIQADPSQGTLVIEFDHGNDPIEVRDTTRGFDVCCAPSENDNCTNSWYWTSTQIVSHDTASVNLKTTVCQGTTSHIAGVRYSWRESPCYFKKCAIYGRDTDLPAPPFIRLGPF